ncbi:DUF5666 domain-containing protein [Actinomadura welshii]
MRTDVKTISAGLAGAGILGLGLYLAVPASAADPDPSASPRAKSDDRDDDRDDDRRFRWGPGWRGHGGHGPGFGRGLGRGLGGVHGEATVRDGDNGFRLVTFQNGEITAVSGATLTVKSDDDVSWTWTTDDDTEIRENRDDAELEDLSAGDEVRITGERSGETRTATFVGVRD